MFNQLPVGRMRLTQCNSWIAFRISLSIYLIVVSPLRDPVLSRLSQVRKAGEDIWIGKQLDICAVTHRNLNWGPKLHSSFSISFCWLLSFCFLSALFFYPVAFVWLFLYSCSPMSSNVFFLFSPNDFFLFVPDTFPSTPFVLILSVIFVYPHMPPNTKLST